MMISITILLWVALYLFIGICMCVLSERFDEQRYSDGERMATIVIWPFAVICMLIIGFYRGTLIACETMCQAVDHHCGTVDKKDKK